MKNENIDKKQHMTSEFQKLLAENKALQLRVATLTAVLEIENQFTEILLARMKRGEHVH